ncbi:hypothetical protein Hanom_Chr04g00323891 [Helianthus anomalus]
MAAGYKQPDQGMHQVDRSSHSHPVVAFVGQPRSDHLFHLSVRSSRLMYRQGAGVAVSPGL